MMVMMCIRVRMPMFMKNFCVPMDVVVLFSDKKYRSDDHDGQSRYEQPIRRLPKQDERKYNA